ncbi:MAG: hypothetical protein QW404_01585 [Candidatus Nanoarchaeia archaeon]
MKQITITITIAFLIIAFALAAEEFGEGSMMISEEQDLSKIINSNLGEGSIKASNVEMVSQGQGRDITFKVKENGYLEINGKRYENLLEGSTIAMDREGNIKAADMTLTKTTNLEIGGKGIQADRGARIVYKNGIVEIYGKEQTAVVDTQSIRINSDSIKLQDNKISGRDFTIGNNIFTSTKKGDLAEVTNVDEGYLLGRNTQVETQSIIANSREGNVLLSKSCQTGSHENYINPCGEKITIQGKGFEASLKEGKNFGVEVQKGDILKYEMSGGKVILSGGEQQINTEKGGIKITNGGIVTRFTEYNGVMHALMDPNSLGKEADVDLGTRIGELAIADNSEDGTQTIYACPVGEVMGATGAASIMEWAKQKCEQYVYGNKKETNKVFQPYEWGVGKTTGNVVKETKLEPLMENGKPVMVDGKQVYYKEVTLQEANGKVHVYRLQSDGSIYEKQPSGWVDTNLIMTYEALRDMEMIPPEPQPTKTAKQKTEDSYKEIGQKYLSNEIYYMRGNDLETLKKGGTIYLREGSTGALIRTPELAVRAVMDRSGKIVKLVGEYYPEDEYIIAEGNKVIKLKKK